MKSQTNHSPFLRVMKFILKALGLILVFGTIIFFLWRVFTSGNPKDMERLTPNDVLREAYKAAEAEGRELAVFTQFQENYITSVQDKNYGYFGITDAKFVTDADQIQVLFRYNNSTIRHLVTDYNLPETPDRDEDLYDVTLYVAYDLTPDISSDNDGNDPASVKFVRYFPTSQSADQKNLYNFRKFVFDGVDMDVTENPVLAVYVDIYYKEDVDYDKESYGTLIIYDYASGRDAYKLDKKEIEALRDTD